MVDIVNVVSAQDMHEAVHEATETDIVIGVAAVSVRPQMVESQKIKKGQCGEPTLTLELVENPDIIAEAATPERSIHCWVRSETEHLEDYAKRKLAGKNLAMIVANNVANTQIGFNSDANATTIFGQGELNIPMMSKRALSERLIAVIADRIEAPHESSNHAEEILRSRAPELWNTRLCRTGSRSRP